MLKIEVKNTDVNERSGNKNNRDWKIRTQEAYAHIINPNGTASPYPEKILLSLQNGNGSRPDQSPYDIGTYYLHPSSCYVGDFNALRLGNVNLMTEAQFRTLISSMFNPQKQAA